MPIPPHVRRRREVLSQIAQETKDVLPSILSQLPQIRATESQVYNLANLPELDVSSASPRFELASSSAPTSSSPPLHKTYGTLIKVLNEDTFDAAIMMADSLTTTTPATGLAAAAAPLPPGRDNNQRIAVMNLASERQPGGGWLTGAVAQEEALCYRSSLALSLHKRYYPLAPLAAVYTRDVVVVRSSMEAGHRLLHTGTSATPVTSLPVMSVISVAGIRKPELSKITLTSPSSSSSSSGEGEGPPPREENVFRHAADRELTKAKMRLTLRIAAYRGHELLVLGALGCGAFRNPPGEVARCWLEVLQEEPEFGGGRRFREIWFAVLDKRNEGNFEVFRRVLGGKEVGKVVV